MSAHPSWCTVCQAGPTRSLGAVHSWCTNCGALYGDGAHPLTLPTKLGPDPRERRIAWDKYAAACTGKGGSAEAAKHADNLLSERDARFAPKSKEGA